MALKSITLSIDPAKVLQNNAVNLFRGDNVEFTLSVATSSVLDLGSVTKWRLKICPIIRGKIDTESANFIAKESTDIATWKVSIASSESAIAAGDYALAVALLDASDEVAIGACFPIKISESGYIGIFTPTEDFRDQVMDALAEAQAARDAAAASATAAAASATSASGSATTATTKAAAAAASETNAAGSASTATTKAAAAAASEEAAAESKDASQQAQQDAEAARDVALATAAGLAGAVQFKGVTSAASAPTSPANGDLWVIGVAGTWGGFTWVVGDYAVYVSASSAWSRIPLATLVTQETTSRKAAQIALASERGRVRCTTVAADYISAPVTISALPMTINISPRRAAAWENGQAILYKISGAISSTLAGLALSVHNSAATIRFSVGDGALAVFNMYQINFPASALPTDGLDHTLSICAAATPEDSVVYIDNEQVTLHSTQLGGFSGSFLNTAPLYAGCPPTNVLTPTTAEVTLSRLQIFNYILPATGGLYSIADYARGLDVPPSLRGLTSGNRCLLALEQPSVGGRVLMDYSGQGNHAVLFGGAAASKVLPVGTVRATLTWAATSDAKALVSASANTIAADTRVVLYAKASTGTPTVAIGNGSTTLTDSATLSTTWQEIGTYFYASAAKLTVQPSASYSGSIYLMARLEPLT